MKGLKWNGYPKSAIKMSSPQRQQAKTNNEPPRATVVLPYIRGLLEPIWRILAPLHITVFSSVQNSIQHPCSPKDPMSPDQRKGVMYRIPCVDCDMTNVGQTGCTIQVRRKEHLRALTNADPQTSALAEHALTHHHEMKPRFWIPTHVWTKDVHKRHGIFVPSPTLWTENLVCYLKCITHWSSLQLHLTLLFDLTFPQFISLFHSSCVCLQSYCIFLIIAHLFPNYH